MDEAYKEFVEKEDYATVQPLLERHPNLVVLGTFSKAYGLAGLRLGYGFADPEVLAVIHRVRSPFNANSAAQVAGIAALQDQDFVRKYVELNLRERRYLSERLTEMGVAWTPSVANFILVDVPIDGREFFEKLLREGVIVRPMGVCGLPDSMRVSVHLREGNNRFLAATKKVLGL
ncbi:MAG: aminotransferase class I/II-fold pyridoxal phosphate-dependent enzyme [Acidobacteriota bacterium]